DAALSQAMELLRRMPGRTVVLVVASPRGDTPAPLVIAGAGVPHGRAELSGAGPGRPLTAADVTASVARLAGAWLPDGATGLPLRRAGGGPRRGGAAGGGMSGVVGAVGLAPVGAVATLVRRVTRLELRPTLRLAGWVMLAGGAVVLALAHEAGRWALVAPGS